MPFFRCEQPGSRPDRVWTRIRQNPPACRGRLLLRTPPVGGRAGCLLRYCRRLRMPRLESAPRAACHDLRVLAANLIRYGNRSVGGGRRARDVAAVAVAVVAAVAAELRPNACCCRGVLKKRAAAQDPLASLSAARSSAAGPSVCWRRLPAAPQSSDAALALGFARIAPKIFGRGCLWRSLGRAVPEEGLARRSVMPLPAGRRPARAAHGAPSARSVAGHF